jgi:hypothetical protein
MGPYLFERPFLRREIFSVCARYVNREAVMIRPIASTIFLAAALSAWAQQPQSPQNSRQQNPSSMAGTNMDDMHHDAEKNPDAARSATDAMSGDMDMNAHIFMTDLRPKNPDDDRRAAQIAEIVRKSIDQYKDYRAALREGYQIFFPNLPQKHYHFTNYRYAYEARFAFNAAHPSSLLYKKVNGTYELEGVMFTARRNATEEELNQRVPLSVARWHKHVNLCLPPKGAVMQGINWKEFGPSGSISTQQACDNAGGRWVPQVFGWMVHVYPYESDPAKIWAH